MNASGKILNIACPLFSALLALGYVLWSFTSHYEYYGNSGILMEYAGMNGFLHIFFFMFPVCVTGVLISMLALLAERIAGAKCGMLTLLFQGVIVLYASVCPLFQENELHTWFFGLLLYGISAVIWCIPAAVIFIGGVCFSAMVKRK